ncbi:MAG: nicotinate-nucleotide adenylyltransferase [Ignavibacteria bacterium]|nr:nicotinate-nucleotide adenylyltransferase [Ignavibacteria bacterium]
MPKTRKRPQIGLFGGSFDPPHLAHLIIAECAREQLELEKVIFIPAHQSPHKTGPILTAPTHRKEMTAIAIEGHSAFEVSDVEMRRKGISYTIDTLKHFRERYPGAELFLIVGSDSLDQFQSWKSPKEILSLATLTVFPRRWGVEVKDKSTIILHAPVIEISSTDIRRRVKMGRTIRYMVPPKVEKYIRLHHLYSM